MNRTRSGSAVVACVAAGLVVAGCPGENRFTASAGGEAVRPQVLQVETPEFITPNDILDVRVSAVSERLITAIDITLLRGLNRDTTVLVNSPGLQIEQRIDFTTPSQFSDNVVLVRVVVRDQGSVTSEPVEVEVPVVDDDNPFVP